MNHYSSVALVLLLAISVLDVLLLFDVGISQGRFRSGWGLPLSYTQTVVLSQPLPFLYTSLLLLWGIFGLWEEGVGGHTCSAGVIP